MIKNFLEFLLRKSLKNGVYADPKDSTKSWIPSSGDRVCKAHFLAGKVSLEFVALGENYFMLLLK